MLVQFLRAHHWLMYHQYIQPIKPLWYIYFIWNLQYQLRKHLLMGQKLTLYHYHMTHQQKTWHLKAILCHTKTHTIWYQTYHINRIQIQVPHILLHHIHLTHWMISIVNKYELQKRNKNKVQSKKHFHDPIKKCVKRTGKYKYKGKEIKLY